MFRDSHPWAPGLITGALLKMYDIAIYLSVLVKVIASECPIHGCNGNLVVFDTTARNEELCKNRHQSAALNTSV